MIEKIEVVGLDPFMLQMGEKHPEEVKQGTSDALRQYAALLADDVRNETPSKSGTARGAVYDEMHNPMEARVGYNLKEAFYMRFYVFGAKPHPILPRGLRGSKVQRQLSAHARRHGAAVDWSNAMNPGWFTHIHSTKRKHALLINGNMRAWANHPGIKAHMTLRRQLDATRDRAPEIVKAAIDARLTMSQ
jgi:hypothetical protein